MSTNTDYFNSRIDPIKFIKWLWPQVTLYPQQKAIVNSVWDNNITVVPAGHMLGKDFITGLICVAFFLTRSPCRIVTTSVDSKQLEGVLWGEINRFINSARFPLTKDRGGPLLVNHLHIRQINPDDKRIIDRSYMIGRVAERGEGLSGHHIERRADGIPRTLFIADECSGIDAESLEKPTEWSHRQLFIANPYECNNPFKWAVKGRPGTEDKGGDIPDENSPYVDGKPTRYLRKIIKIRAVDSPNVRYAMKELEKGKKPSRRIIVPGVIGYDDYILRRKTWDDVKQTVGLDAEFYEGHQALLFAPHWLDRAEEIAWKMERANIIRVPTCAGIDCGEGRADTVFYCGDQYGLIDEVCFQESNANHIVSEIIAFINKHKLPHHRVLLDRGGGGRQIADFLREKGYNVNTIAFGSGVGRPGEEKKKRRKKSEIFNLREDRGVYLNRRSQMYGEASEILDPHNLNRPQGFGIPARFFNLRQQLALIPRRLDGEGRIILPPKNKRRKDSTEETMECLIGRSPDHADAAVLCIHALLHNNTNFNVGAIDFTNAQGYNIGGIGNTRRFTMVDKDD